MGFSSASLALFSNLWLAAGMLALGGAGNMVAIIPSATLVQRVTPNEVLGRVLSLRIVLFSVAGLASNALAGVGAERFGVQPMWAIIGTLLVLLGLVGFLVPSARNVGGSDTQSSG
jgi:hypothetical protein